MAAAQNVSEAISKLDEERKKIAKGLNDIEHKEKDQSQREQDRKSVV